MDHREKKDTKSCIKHPLLWRRLKWLVEKIKECRHELRWSAEIILARSAIKVGSECRRRFMAGPISNHKPYLSTRCRYFTEDVVMRSRDYFCTIMLFYLDVPMRYIQSMYIT